MTRRYNSRMDTTLQADELVRIFAANVRARRTELKLSQAQLAKASSVTQPCIAQIESGKRAPSIEFLAPLAVALSTTPDALITPNIFSATG